MIPAVVTIAGRAAVVGPWVAAMRRGETFGIDVVVVAPVSQREAWDVLTDFDAMASFVPNLESSHIVSRDGDRLRVEQRGEARWGPITKRFTTLRDVQLVPVQSVSSESVEGSMPRVKSLTRFKEVAGGTEIWHRVDIVFETWMPDFLAERFLQYEMDEQFRAVVDEMLRRRASRGK